MIGSHLGVISEYSFNDFTLRMLNSSLPIFQSTAESVKTTTSENQTLYDKGLKEMSKLDYMTQMKISSIYRDFYEDFKDYISKLNEQDSKKVIT